jgi:hypothetical protein
MPETIETSSAVHGLAEGLIAFMETGVVPDGLFAEDVFTDFTMPQWRLQGGTRDQLVALRLAGHPGAGRVPRSRLDATTTGFCVGGGGGVGAGRRVVVLP